MLMRFLTARFRKPLRQKPQALKVRVKHSLTQPLIADMAQRHDDATGRPP